jgi:hypothetical protein
MSASSLRQAGLFNEDNAEPLQNGNAAHVASKRTRRSAAVQARTSANELMAIVHAAFGEVEQRLASLELLPGH